MEREKVSIQVKGLIADFWNAKESLEYAYKMGYSADVESAFKRMNDIVKELVSCDFLTAGMKMPTLDEIS